MVASEFKEILLPISEKLLMLATHMLKDENQAKDVVQDVFLKLWKKRDSLDKIENIEGYVKRMCRNRCIDIMRANKIVPLDEGYAEHVESNATDVQTKLEWSETAAEIKAIIDDLPHLQRTIMTMRDLDQLSFDEIEEKTKMKRNSIRVNLSRARHRVRLELLKRRKHGTQRRKNISSKIL